MTPTEWLVVALGVALIVAVNWWFFFSGGEASPDDG